jgi:flagellar hook-associated protein 1 FlgK
MGIYSALSVGQTALSAAQTALEVVGNNIANANTPNYSRQEVSLIPAPSVHAGLNIGTGVKVQAITRIYDAAVEARLRSAMSDSQSQQTQSQALGQIESLFGDTSATDLSSTLTNFFNSFSALATDPSADSTARETVVQAAQQVVSQIQNLRSGLNQQRVAIDGDIQSNMQEVNRLSTAVANLNQQIMTTEQGQTGSAPGLEDERDGDLQALAKLINIRTVTQNNGSVNVIVGNQMLVDGTQSRQLTTKIVQDRGQNVSEVQFADNSEPLALTSGTLQGEVYSRDQWIGQQIDSLDTLTQNLIFQVNSLQAGGTGTTQPNEICSDAAVVDPTAALSSPAAGLHNLPVNGSFMIHVTNNQTGQVETTLLAVDLDGLGADDSLNSLAAKLNTVPDVSATVDAAGHLVIQGTSSDISLSFEQDSSHVLAALGLNGLFTGYDSSTIGLSQQVVDDPGLLAAGLTSGPGDNATALANLAAASLPALGNMGILDYQQQTASKLASNTAAVGSASTAADNFQSSMSDEQQTVSGVSLDEEATNLIRYQNLYTAAAKFMSTMSDMLDVLMKM